MKHLTSAQRYVIKLMLCEGKSQKEIVQSIDVHKSTISWELKPYHSWERGAIENTNELTFR